MKALTLCAIVAAATLACATAGKMNKVSIGMTRDEVVAAMGEPSSTSASADVEYLNRKATNYEFAYKKQVACTVEFYARHQTRIAT